jgi:hypothetical protein
MYNKNQYSIIINPTDMKKIILSAVAMGGLAMTSFGQGVIYFDGSNNTSTSPTATSEGQVFLNGVLDTSTDINVELLYGASATTVTSDCVTLLLSDSTGTENSAPGGLQPASGDVTDYGSGVLFDASGVGYQLTGTSSGATEFFQVLAWTGNFSSYAAALTAGTGQTGSSSVFSEILTSATGEANDIEGMSALDLTTSAVPEPTTMALAGLGGLSLFLLRRKK